MLLSHEGVKMFKRGNALTVFLLLVMALGVFYFISAPFQAKIDSAVAQATKWTPENIQKDPVGYLSWAQKECEHLLAQLEAREIAMKTKKNEAERELMEKEVDFKNFSELLIECKDAYKNASINKAFPITLRSIQLDEPQLKAKFLEVFQKIELIKKEIPVYKNTIAIMTQNLIEIHKKNVDGNTLQKKIGTDIELTKLQKENSGLNGLSSEFNTLVDTTSAVIKTDVTFSVEDLTKINPKEKATLDFEKIMNSN